MGSTSNADLSSRARIRDAAINRYATDGLSAPVRRIAEDASVSPGLVIHHFGSVDGLRQTCDQHVLDQMRTHKTNTLAGGPQGSTALLNDLAQARDTAPLVGYVLRRLQAGGGVMRAFIDDLSAEAVDYLRAGEELGTVRPSRFPEARARVLTEQAIGALLLQIPSPGERMNLEKLAAWFADYSQRIVGPLLELYTEPLLTDSSLLDAYLNQD